MGNLAAAIEQCLRETPGQSARDLVRDLASRGVSTDKSSVNSALYRHSRSRFIRIAGTPPTWANRLGDGADAAAVESYESELGGAIPPPSGGDAIDFDTLMEALREIIEGVKSSISGQPQESQSISLYAWQQQAIDAWKAEGRCGVVEAVTGTGKTRVGMVAIQGALEDGGDVHVLVPTIDLQEQWFAELQSLFPQFSIGRRGDGHMCDFSDHNVIVSVINSARDFDVGELPEHSLLVADECHRYGADANAQALHEAFDRRLGLTATYARDDDGNERNLDPYFGDTCFRMGYEQAIADEVTAHFKVAMVGVDFPTEEEKAAYEAAARECGLARKWLTESGWAVDEPFGEFMKDVAALSDNRPRRSGTRDAYAARMKARAYLGSFSHKRKLLADTTAKLDALRELASCVEEAGRTIVFTETIEAADAAAEALRECGIESATIHSQLDKQERRRLLASFKADEIRVITAPKVLDEGIDVPEADLAIIFATSKTRRQMVQRMGRVLRRKQDGRLARFILLYVAGTSEAPESGAHESFLEEITDVADDVQTFDSETDWDEIIEYVNDFEVPGGQPEPRMAER